MYNGLLVVCQEIGDWSRLADITAVPEVFILHSMLVTIKTSVCCRTLKLPCSIHHSK